MKKIISLALLLVLVTAAHAEETYEGILMFKGWSKTAESYRVGGSSYFKLCTDGEDIKKIRDGEYKDCIGLRTVILRATENVTSEELKKHVGKIIKVSGEWEKNERKSHITQEELYSNDEYKEFRGSQMIMDYSDMMIDDLTEDQPQGDQESQVKGKKKKNISYRLPGTASLFKVNELENLER